MTRVPNISEKFTFEDQLKYEAEGKAAAHSGLKRSGCPYNKETQSGEWNHWVYGNEVEEGNIFWAKVPEEEKQGMCTATNASEEEIRYITNKMQKLRKKYA